MKKIIVNLTLSLVVIFAIPSIASAFSVTAGDATGINNGIATLNGSATITNSDIALYPNGFAFIFALRDTTASDCGNIYSGTNHYTGYVAHQVVPNGTTVITKQIPDTTAIPSLTNQTYYYCIIGAPKDSNGLMSNSNRVYSQVKSFVGPSTGYTPPVTPIIVSQAATDITFSSAKLHALLTPKQSGVAYFRHTVVNSTDTQPTTCSDSWSQTPYVAFSGNAALPMSAQISGFTPSYAMQTFTKIHYFCPVFRFFPTPSTVYESKGVLKSFTQPYPQCGDGIDNDGDNKIDMLDPGCDSLSDDDEGTGHRVNTATNATNITDTTATISGSAVAIPLANAVTPVYGYFRYSTKAPGSVAPIFCNEVFGDDMKSTIEVKISDNAPVGARKTFATPISSLEPNTTYYYCAVATDKKIIEYGKIESFTTANDPNVSLSSIQTKPATSVGANSASLNGKFNSAIASTTWFEYRKKQTYQNIINSAATVSPSVSLSSAFSPTNTFSSATANAINLSLSPTSSLISGMNTLNVGNTGFNSTTPTTFSTSAAMTSSHLSNISTNPYNWSGKINSQSHLAGASGTMSYLLKNLEKNTTYEFRAVIQTNITGNSPQVSYGDILTFRTSSSSLSDGDVEHGGNNDNEKLNLGDTATPPDDAIVHYHEGIEHVLVRQLMRDYNRELVEKLGYQDSMNLETFAWDTADFLARTFGYVSPSGKEIRVGPPDMAAYRLVMIDGKLTIYEYFDSEIVAIQDITSSLRKSFEYEYYYTKKVSQ